MDASELRAKKDEAHQEWLGLQDEFRAEREEMLEELRDLEKHLKLDDTIIQHFVPAEAVEMIQKRATWDEQLDNWVLAPLSATDHDGEPILEPRPRCAVTARSTHWPINIGWIVPTAALTTTPTHAAANQCHLGLTMSHDTRRMPRPSLTPTRVCFLSRPALGSNK